MRILCRRDFWKNIYYTTSGRSSSLLVV